MVWQLNLTNSRKWLNLVIAYQSMGDAHRSLTSEEEEMALKMRRSIVCKKIFSLTNL